MLSDWMRERGAEKWGEKSERETEKGGNNSGGLKSTMEENLWEWNGFEDIAVGHVTSHVTVINKLISSSVTLKSVFLHYSGLNLSLPTLPFNLFLFFVRIIECCLA